MRLYWLGVLLCWAVLGCAFAGGIDELAAARAQPAAKRIVALSWEAAENLLELGITPLAGRMPTITGAGWRSPCCRAGCCPQAADWSRIWNCWPA